MQKEDLLSRIKLLCSENGISMAELERNLGFSNSSVSKWDRAAPSIDKISLVADHFNVSIDYLTGRTEITTTADQALSDPSIITIQRLRSNLSRKDNEKMMQMLKIQFSEDFPDENE